MSSSTASGTKSSAAGEPPVAQWDVYVNPVARARELLPFVVVVQSDLLDGLPTRLVIPLSRSAVVPRGMPGRLVPAFDVLGEPLLLKAHEAGILLARDLRRPVMSLRDRAHLLIDAIDAVVSGV
jgi:toxin CcdB